MFFSNVIMTAIFAAGPAFANPPFGFIPCESEPKIQAERSKELQQLLSQDQSDYRAELDKHPERPLDIKKMIQMAVNDLKRRKRVGEILAEGCFKSASDYSAAAMIYQHGNAPDHFFQAFIWALKAVTLGDSTAKELVALTVDRYLIKSGHKQIFGNQLEKIENRTCLCMAPVEESFPDSKRSEYLGRDLADQIAHLKEKTGNNLCRPLYCPVDLKPSPAGTLIGFW